MVGFNNGLIKADNISFDNGSTQILTDGQLIIGDSTGNPKISTLIAGSNVTITNGQGSITIAAAGGGGTSLSPYIVGPTNSDFTTIQDAITAAIAAGASDSSPINIYIKPGTYIENLTSQAGIRLIGLGAGASSSSNDFPPLSVIWNGICTLASGTMVFESIRIAYSGSSTAISSGGNLKFKNCQFFGATGTYISTTADGKSLEFETCFLNTGTFFSSTKWVDMRFQNSYLAGSFTIGGVGNQLIIEKSTISSGFTLSASSNVSFIFQWCDILSPILIDTTASTTAGISCELNFCKAYSTSTALLKVNKASASINNCTINGNTYFIDDSVGTGSNSYFVRNSTVSNSQAVNLGNNSNVYLYNCNLQGFGTPTLGTGAKVHYIDSFSGNGNTITNSDQLSTSATDGFLHIPSCNGSPTGTPTSYGSAIPMVYDATNDIPWFYNGSWHGGGGSGYTSITPYIVGPVGDIHAGFTTIQAAIDQIVTDGLSSANIYIKPGNYFENLTFPASTIIFLMGLSAGNQTHEFSGLGAFINPDTIISGSITGTGVGSISNCQITSGTATLADGFQFVGCYINSYSITNSASIRINFNDCRFSSSSIDSISNKYLLFQMVNCALGATITAHSGNGDFYQFDNCQFDNSSSIINAATSGIGIVINNCSIQSSTLIDSSAATTSTDLVLYNCNFGNSCTYGIRAKNNLSARITQCTTNQSMTYFIDDSAGGSNSYQIYDSTLLTSFGINSGTSSNFLIYNSYCNFPNGLTLGNNATVLFSSSNTAGSGTPTLGSGATVTYLNSVNYNNQYQSDNSSSQSVYADKNQQVWFPKNAIFNAYNSNDIANVTGDGTDYTIPFDTVIIDNQSGWNTGTAQYQIPATTPSPCFWKFHSKVTIGNVGAGHTSGLLTIHTPNRNLGHYFNPAASKDTSNMVTVETYGMMNGIGPDAVPNKAYVSIQVSGSTKTVAVKGVGGGTNITDFTAELVGVPA